MLSQTIHLMRKKVHQTLLWCLVLLCDILNSPVMIKQIRFVRTPLELIRTCVRVVHMDTWVGTVPPNSTTSWCINNRLQIWRKGRPQHGLHLTSPAWYWNSRFERRPAEAPNPFLLYAPLSTSSTIQLHLSIVTQRTARVFCRKRRNFTLEHIVCADVERLLATAGI